MQSFLLRGNGDRLEAEFRTGNQRFAEFSLRLDAAESSRRAEDFYGISMK